MEIEQVSTYVLPMTLIAWQEKRRNYNHGQKSWDTFAFLGVFQFTQAQPLPSPHKQCWTHVSMDRLDKTSAAFGIEISAQKTK